MDSEFTAEDLDLVLQSDLQAIVRKGKEGKALSARERTIVEDARRRFEPDPPPAGPDFQLQVERPATALTGLTQGQLSERWDYSPRQIKNWLKDGKLKSDPVPIDRPEEMPAWFERVYTPRQCPERLRLAADRLREEIAGPAKSEPAPVAARVERIEVAESEMGLLAMLQRLRSSEARLYAEYEALVLAGDEAKAKFVFSQWGQVSERLRAAEKGAPKTLEELGIYVRRDEVTRELGQLHGSILKSLKQALRKSRVELRATTSAAEWNQKSDALIEEAAGALCDSGFAEPLELEPAA